MASAIKVKPGFNLAELNPIDRRLADEASYQQKLHKLQIALLEVEQIYRVEDGAVVAVEGWDASGKGGATQRLTEKLDPRWVRVWSIGRPAPTSRAAIISGGFGRGCRRPAKSRSSTGELVRPGSSRTGRRPGQTKRVAARL